MRCTRNGWASTAAELFVFLKMATRLAVAWTAVAAVAGIVLWIPVSLLSDLSVEESIVTFWPVVLALAILPAIMIWGIFRRQDRLFSELSRLSKEPPNRDVVETAPIHLTGGVIFRNRLLGPLTMSATTLGICFSRFGTIRAYFPWSSFHEIVIRTHRNGAVSAVLNLDGDDGTSRELVRILWDERLTQSVPPNLRRREVFTPAS